LEESSSSVVQAIWQGNPENGSFVESWSTDSDCAVILDKTFFYAESGGQIYDTGFLEAEGFLFLVKEVKVSALSISLTTFSFLDHLIHLHQHVANTGQVFGGYVAHVGSVKQGDLKVGASIQCSVNYERRRPIMANHTSTHLINYSLQKILPSDTEQRGSIVSEDKFRFDFTCPEALSREQIFNVEEEVKTLIKSSLPVHTKEIPLELANKIYGRRAIFTEVGFFLNLISL
jgi:alanyl-tRNA synthetase